MKVGKFLVAFVFSLIFMAGNSVAMADDALLNDIQVNPQNYIANGGAGTGLSLWIFKPSLNVEQYAPPKYIISIKRVMYSNQMIKKNGEWVKVISADWYGVKRYLYSYDERKIYVEEKDSSGNFIWQDISLKIAEGGGSLNPYTNDLSAAELAFYFAYNKSFFDEPLSFPLKKCIETGELFTFDS